jgi:hypothetical protein
VPFGGSGLSCCPTWSCRLRMFFCRHDMQGCQILLYLIYQNGGKFSTLTLNTELPNGNIIYVPYGSNIFQMTIEYPNFFHSKASKIYPNLDFWFENMPSGNPRDMCQPATYLWRLHTY